MAQNQEKRACSLLFRLFFANAQLTQTMAAASTVPAIWTSKRGFGIKKIKMA